MKYTLITGASKGIGKAIAREFASRGYNVILIARNEEKLKETTLSLTEEYGIKAVYCVQDLSKEDASDNILQWCNQENLPVNILVNNVGFGVFGYFHENSQEDIIKILSLNIEVVVKLTHKFIPELKKHKGAHILNVSSIAAFQPVPFLNLYSASKAFLNSFTLGLREELRDFNINVSCLAPGPTDSDFFNKSGVGRNYDLSSVKMDPEEVARVGVDQLFSRKSLIIPGLSNKVGAFISKRISSVPIVKIISKIFKPVS